MEVLSNKIAAKDIQLFYYLNRRIKNRLFDILLLNITHLGGIYFTLTLIVFLLVLQPAVNPFIGVELAVVQILSQIFVHTIKRIIDRKRPYLNLDNIKIINEPLESYSFPSGHTTASFSTAYLLSLCLPHFSLLFFSLAVLVAVSRIYLGLHYPSDILMGILTAILFSKLVHEIFIQVVF